jgi:hypothetical protein
MQNITDLLSITYLEAVRQYANPSAAPHDTLKYRKVLILTARTLAKPLDLTLP